MRVRVSRMLMTSWLSPTLDSPQTLSKLQASPGHRMPGPPRSYIASVTPCLKQEGQLLCDLVPLLPWGGQGLSVALAPASTPPRSEASGVSLSVGLRPGHLGPSWALPQDHVIQALSSTQLLTWDPASRPCGPEAFADMPADARGLPALASLPGPPGAARSVQGLSVRGTACGPAHCSSGRGCFTVNK